jgi:DNA-binding response OmpR family regulator
MAAMSVSHPLDDVIEVGELSIHLADGLVRAGGDTVMLSVREFALLLALARRGGRILSREQLYREVWGGPLTKGERSVDVYVHKLRVKLEAARPGMKFIHTHFGFGYRLWPEPSHVLHNSMTGP